MVGVCAPHARRAWDRLAADVDAALADDKMPPSFEVARGLEFIEQCANEALRRRPVAPLSLLENNLQPRSTAFHLVPGTLVICLMRSGAVDSRLAADAAEFRPARWREGPSADASAADGEPRRAQGLCR
jgi:cytochrome P450